MMSALNVFSTDTSSRSVESSSRKGRAPPQSAVLHDKSDVKCHARVQQNKAFNSSLNLTSCESEGAGYMSNADRFLNNTAAEEYAARQEALRRKQNAIEYRRNQNMVREEDRWKQMDNVRNTTSENEKRLRDEGMTGKKNASNVAYNILNLQYKKDKGGETQKLVDDKVRYRAELRSTNLTMKGDSRSNFNIISGLQREDPKHSAEVTNYYKVSK